MKKLLDDPGTLIYVAFVAISLIAGYLKNLKKKREAQLEGHFEESERSHPQIEPDLFETAKNEIDAEKRISEMKAKTQIALLAKNQREWRIRKRKTEIKLAVENESELDLSEAYSNNEYENFDMKKAVIYSEILNPPYL